MPIYLGSTEVLATVADPDKGIYLGDQKICSTFLGSSQTLDNCTYTPVVVTLNVNTGQITGSGYTVGGANTGSSQSGQAGVDTYSFTTTIQADSGWSFTSGPTISPNPNTGTFPSSNTTVTTSISGTVEQDAVPSSRINYSASTSLAGASAGIDDPSAGYRDGTPGQSDGNITVSFSGSSDYTYDDLEVAGVFFSYGSSATFSPGTTFPADGTSTPSSWSVTGTATPVQYTYTYNISAGTVSNGASTSYSVSGGTLTDSSDPRTGSLGANTSATVTVEGIIGTSISASISASANSGYILYSSPTSDSSSTTITSGGGSASISINAEANLIYNDIYATGPYTTYYDANNCLQNNVNCQSGLSVWYAGGSSGVLGSSPYFTSWSAASGPSGALPNGYYIDEDASPRTIFS
tara:strand:- start:21 stop:1244 length:1224 start_codon:yes stop_codon:yes gene_type:complete